MTSPRTSPSSPSNKNKRRRMLSSAGSTSSSSAPPPTSLAALPPPIISNAASSVSPMPPPSPIGVAYYPVYSTHNGQFYIVSPPLHPTSIPSSSSHPAKILPKLSPSFQTPTPPLPPSPAPYPFYHHPYQPPITPPSALQPTYPFVSHTAPETETTADQREQARKVSHSAIERRRRERINDKIMQLKQLIPTCADQENLHKMSILQSAIDYITYLKEIVEPKALEESLKPKDLFRAKKATYVTATPSTTESTLPTNMSVKNLLC